MREKFPEKKAGDSLSHGHVNDLSDVSRRFAGFRTGPGLHVHHGKSFVGIAADPALMQYIIEISNTKIVWDDEDDSGLYLGKVCYYSATDGEWRTEDKEWEVDGGVFDLTNLQVGNRIVCFWHSQRGMFVPASSPQMQASWIEFTADGAFTTADAGIAVKDVIYHNGNEPSTPVTIVYNKAISTDYLFEGDDGDMGMALYDSTDDHDPHRYTVVQFECP